MEPAPSCIRELLESRCYNLDRSVEADDWYVAGRHTDGIGDRLAPVVGWRGLSPAFWRSTAAAAAVTEAVSAAAAVAASQVILRRQHWLLGVAAAACMFSTAWLRAARA